MKYYFPLPPVAFDVFCDKNDVAGLPQYTLEKLTQLDSQMLMAFKNTELADLYRMCRQTITGHLHILTAKNIILDTKIGKIICLPTYTGFFGVYYAKHENLYQFVLTLPNTQIQYFVDIYLDEFKSQNSDLLTRGKCYYLMANIKVPTIYPTRNSDTPCHINYTATDCMNFYEIENIGYGYQDKIFIKNGS